LLRTRNERPNRSRTSNNLYKFAPPHCRPRGFHKGW
jgi:hypothetical protein